MLWVAGALPDPDPLTLPHARTHTRIHARTQPMFLLTFFIFLRALPWASLAAAALRARASSTIERAAWKRWMACCAPADTSLSSSHLAGQERQ